MVKEKEEDNRPEWQKKDEKRSKQLKKDLVYIPEVIPRTRLIKEIK